MSLRAAIAAGKRNEKRQRRRAHTALLAKSKTDTSLAGVLYRRGRLTFDQYAKLAEKAER